MTRSDIALRNGSVGRSGPDTPTRESLSQRAEILQILFEGAPSAERWVEMLIDRVEARP